MSEDYGIEKAYEVCYGTWDSNFKECTEMCKIASKCKKATEAKGRERPVVKVDDEMSEISGMEPMQYFEESLRGKFDIKEASDKKRGIDKAFLLSKDDKKCGRIFWGHGMIKIETNNKITILVKQEDVNSCEIAHSLFKSFILFL